MDFLLFNRLKKIMIFAIEYSYVKYDILLLNIVLYQIKNSNNLKKKFY